MQQKCDWVPLLKTTPKNYIFLHSLSLITVEFLLTHICIWRRHCRCILMKWERIMMLVSVTDPAGVLLLFLKMLGHVCLIHLFDATDEIIAQCFITSLTCKFWNNCLAAIWAFWDSKKVCCFPECSCRCTSWACILVSLQPKCHWEWAFGMLRLFLCVSSMSHVTKPE